VVVVGGQPNGAGGGVGCRRNAHARKSVTGAGKAGCVWVCGGGVCVVRVEPVCRRLFSRIKLMSEGGAMHTNWRTKVLLASGNR